jgi:DNA (cytosine-5)-methyltransferase 1
MIKYIDLFSGIGGFRIAARNVFNKYKIDGECVFSSDIDIYAQQSYHANFGEFPTGDITKIDENDIPDHDILFAGFPCQPFSIIGKGKGFDDIRGTLFFDIARILKAKNPMMFILENVKQLTTHNEGKTFNRIREVLSDLGYYHEYKVLNALDYGLPQKRERVIIVGFKQEIGFEWPEKANIYTVKSNIRKECN